MLKPAKILEKLIRPFVRRQNTEAEKEEEDLKVIAAKDQKVFRYEILVSATRNFKNKLGQGGFGPVFKGQLEDGRVVAVKRLGFGSRQGVREFTNEATLLSRVQHKNVVNLHGYCARANDKLLVYEYVPNESLDRILFSRQNKVEGAVLDWKKRYEVIVGVARGIQYLHEDAHTPIIHRDIKASNILLDESWCPKIADFGMARLFPDDLTHVNTRVVGTNCYMAPEYAMHGLLSTKVDVFSFGVLMIEVITGQKSSEFISDSSTLIEWAWLLHCKRQWMEMLDPALRSKADVDQVVHCAHIALLCVQSDPKVRPNMRRVLKLLSKKPSALEEPIRPGISGYRYRVTAEGPSGSWSDKTVGEPSTSSSSAATSFWSMVSNVDSTPTSFLSLASTTTSSDAR